MVEHVISSQLQPAASSMLRRWAQKPIGHDYPQFVAQCALAIIVTLICAPRAHYVATAIQATALFLVAAHTGLHLIGRPRSGLDLSFLKRSIPQPSKHMHFAIAWGVLLIVATLLPQLDKFAFAV